MALTSDPCSDRPDESLHSDRLIPPTITKHQMLLPTTFTLPFIVIPLIASQKGWKLFLTVCQGHLPALLLRFDKMGRCSEDRPAFEVTSFLVAVHNFKCPYINDQQLSSSPTHRDHLQDKLSAMTDLWKLWLVIFVFVVDLSERAQVSCIGRFIT